MAVLAFALYSQGRIADARTVIVEDFLSMFSGQGNERTFAMVLAMQSADEGEMSLALEVRTRRREHPTRNGSSGAAHFVCRPHWHSTDACSSWKDSLRGPNRCSANA